MILVETMFIIMWIHSDQMHIDHSGYNLRIRIYLNGGGLGKSKSLICSLLFSKGIVMHYYVGNSQERSL